MHTFSTPVSDDEVEMAIYEKEDVELECLDLAGRPAISGPDYIVDLDGSAENHVEPRDKDNHPSPPGLHPATTCTWSSVSL